MQTSYIYSASRVNALSEFLLTKTDIERLLVAQPGEDLQSALKETYLAPFVLRVEGENVAEAIEQTLIDAKRLVHRIAPNGNMFRVLWVQYDIHNLRIFTKAVAGNKSFGEIAPLTSQRGIYDPEELYTYAEDGELNRLQDGWQDAYDAALRHVEARELDKVDAVFDVVFFKTARKIAKDSKDAFVQSYLKTAIDLYNLKSRLRVVTHPSVNFGVGYVEGGSIAEAALETKEQVLNAFSQFGGESFWREAIEYYEESGNTTQVDARADDYLVSLTKEASFDVFSSATLMLYYLKCRQAAANIRTIVVGKNSGMSEAAIRRNLRMAYVNE